MARPSLPVVLRAASLTFAAMWLIGALSLVAKPGDAYEVAARAFGGDPPAKEAYALWAAAEGALAVGMLLGAFRGFLATALAVAAMTAALLVVRSRYGGGVPCGCMAILPDPSIDGALVRNALLVAAAIACDVLARVNARRERSRRAAADAGPATPTP